MISKVITQQKLSPNKTNMNPEFSRRKIGWINVRKTKVSIHLVQNF